MDCRGFSLMCPAPYDKNRSLKTWRDLGQTFIQLIDGAVNRRCHELSVRLSRTPVCGVDDTSISGDVSEQVGRISTVDVRDWKAVPGWDMKG